jgi:hypothetical protein
MPKHILRHSFYCHQATVRLHWPSIYMVLLFLRVTVVKGELREMREICDT